MNTRMMSQGKAFSGQARPMQGAQRMPALRATSTSTQLQADLSSPSGDVLPRRLALMGLAALTLLPMGQAQAVPYKSELCVLQDSEEAADACRQSQINRDATKQEDYGVVTDRKFNTVSGVPVSVLDSEYTRSSKELISLIQSYCTLDPYNKERIAVTKKLKLDGIAWVSKYARGGSARSESARRLYIAVDGVVGFLASNGLAPYPKQKVKVTLATLEQATAFLEQGK